MKWPTLVIAGTGLVGGVVSATQNSERLSGTKITFPSDMGRPELLTGRAGSIAFVDYGSVALYLRSRRGEWKRISSTGGGPGEIRAPMGLQFDDSGRLWISDRTNGRISVRSQDGQIVVREFRTSLPVTSIAPGRNGRLLALSETALAVVLDSTGNKVAEIALPRDLKDINPVTNERFLLRLTDSTAVVTYKWYDRRVGVSIDGHVLFDSTGPGAKPEVLALRLDKQGSLAYRVKPGQRERVISATASGDTVFELRGDPDSTVHGRRVLRVHGLTGRTLGTLSLTERPFSIAAADSGLLGLVEDDEGFTRYSFRRSVRRVP
jgi:hypothetical protein